MAAIKLLNLIAITTLALVASSFNTPVGAVATGHQHFARHSAHEGIAHVKRAKRGENSRRCKTRAASASAIPTPTLSSVEIVLSTSIAVETPKTTKQATTTKAADPVPTVTSIPSTSGGGGSGGKLGIAYNNANAASLGNLLSDHTGWYTTWSPYQLPNSFGLDFLGMIWGPKQMGDFYKQKQGFAKALAVGNEPDEPSQLNMSPEDFAGWWKSEIEKLAGQYDLYSPAVTGPGDRGKTWFRNFVNSCNGDCSFSHISIHFYGTEPQDFINHVKYWHDTYGKPVVVTEFAPMNFGGGSAVTADKVWAFYQKVIPWLDSQDFVTAYFPFGFLEDMGNVNYLDQLMSGGKPTDLGKFVLYH